jgi:hypothetical protein
MCRIYVKYIRLQLESKLNVIHTSQHPINGITTDMRTDHKVLSLCRHTEEREFLQCYY